MSTSLLKWLVALGLAFVGGVVALIILAPKAHKEAVQQEAKESVADTLASLQSRQDSAVAVAADSAASSSVVLTCEETRLALESEIAGLKSELRYSRAALEELAGNSAQANKYIRQAAEAQQEAKGLEHQRDSVAEAKRKRWPINDLTPKQRRALEKLYLKTPPGLLRDSIADALLSDYNIDAAK